MKPSRPWVDYASTTARMRRERIERWSRAFWRVVHAAAIAVPVGLWLQPPWYAAISIGLAAVAVVSAAHRGSDS
jgi:hypothetical protein